MIRATVRRARKHHRCDCGRQIKPGERYRESVISPHADGDVCGNSRWLRIAVCAECARRYGRPIPEAAAA